MLVHHFTEQQAQEAIQFCEQNGIKYKVKNLRKPIWSEKRNVSVWAYVDWRDDKYAKYSLFIRTIEN